MGEGTIIQNATQFFGTIFKNTIFAIGTEGPSKNHNFVRHSLWMSPNVNFFSCEFFVLFTFKQFSCCFKKAGNFNLKFPFFKAIFGCQYVKLDSNHESTIGRRDRITSLVTERGVYFWPGPNSKSPWSRHRNKSIIRKLISIGNYL